MKGIRFFTLLHTLLADLAKRRKPAGMGVGGQAMKGLGKRVQREDWQWGKQPLVQNN